MSRPFCNLTETPVILHIDVTDEDTNTPVEGANVRVYISGSAKEVITQTNSDVSATVEIEQNRRYTIAVYVTDLQPLTTTTDVICNLTACELCCPVVPISLSTPPEETKIPECEKPAERSLTVTSFDSTNKKSIPGASVNIQYYGNTIADKAGFNGWNIQDKYK